MWRNVGDSCNVPSLKSCSQKKLRWRKCRCRQIWPLEDWGQFRWCPAQLKFALRDHSWSHPLLHERCRHTGRLGPWLPSQNPTPTGRDAWKCRKWGREGRKWEAEAKREAKVPYGNEIGGGGEREKGIIYFWQSGCKISIFSHKHTYSHKHIHMHTFLTTNFFPYLSIEYKREVEKKKEWTFCLSLSLHYLLLEQSDWLFVLCVPLFCSCYHLWPPSPPVLRLSLIFSPFFHIPLTVGPIQLQ